MFCLLGLGLGKVHSVIYKIGPPQILFLFIKLLFQKSHLGFYDLSNKILMFGSKVTDKSGGRGSYLTLSLWVIHLQWPMGAA